VVIAMSAGTRPDGPRRGRIARIALALAALGLALAAGSASAAGPEVVVLPTTGEVDPTMADYLRSSIAQAESDHAAAVVIKLNTPGGRLDSMNDIVGILLEAKVPIIVWVAPAGGFAASAGTFITLASNIALMAPGTSIGAASPISGDGTDIPGTLGEKVKNDAIAKITSIAQARGRNVEWAVSTVRDARSSSAQEAVSLHAVDGIAATLDEVLAFANGKTVKVAGQDVTLDLTGATTTERGLNPFVVLFRILADPTIVGLLFTIGSAGIIAELWAPNFVTGIIGGLAILLALILGGSLPLNIGGLALLLFGMVLFGLEVTVTSHGLLGLGGVICVVLGLSALFTAPVDPFAPLVQVAPGIIVVVAVTLGLVVALIVFGVLRSRTYGRGGPIVGLVEPGARGLVRSPLKPVGSVIAGGEEWSARTANGEQLGRGTAVRVIKVEGLTLTVEPDASSSSGT
jgi:membrane-bound serine protease (ClpP class)